MQQLPKNQLIFLIIDDDPLSVFLSRNVIQNTVPEAVIIDFTEAAKGLDFIKEVSASDETPPLLLFLDLNMPEMDGRQFLQKFAELDESIRCKVKIAILSSSINETDTSIPDFNKVVSMFISKPLIDERVTEALGKTKYID